MKRCSLRFSSPPPFSILLIPSDGSELNSEGLHDSRKMGFA